MSEEIREAIPFIVMVIFGAIFLRIIWIKARYGKKNL